jgi:subtilase family serine protease
MAGSGSLGYSPQQIDSAYGISNISFSGVSGDGAGQTIAIVDAYNDPNITSDLAAFDKQYGLSAPPSFTVDNLGATTTDPGWAVETALDVEWAHAVAPEANLVLVEAPNASLNSLLNAVSTAAKVPNVSVVSMSWGTSEYYGEWNDEGVFNTPSGHTGETFVAASGDTGAWSGPSFPAVTPNVLGVGGTTLTLGSGNSYGSERGWAYSTGGFSGLDNGFGYGLSEPGYQTSTLSAAGLNYGLRTSPDVSLNADPNTGYSVYDSVPYYGSSGWFDVGGTSAAAPAWAGLVAITDQGLASAGKSTLTTSQLLTNLYSLPSSDFNQVNSGFNGYSAGSGYNLVAGLGSPKANQLVPAVLAANGVTASSGATTPKAPAATAQPNHSSLARNAAIISAASTSTSSAATTAVITAGFSAGLSSLSTPTAAPSATAGSSGQAVQAGTSSVSSGAVQATGIGFGQGAAISMAGARSETGRASEGVGAAVDSIDAPKATEPGAPESPTAPSPETGAPTPATSPRDGAEAGERPASSRGSSSDATSGAGDAAFADAPAAAFEAETKREEDDGDGGSLAGLVVAGAVLILSPRVVIERGRRRQSLMAAFRPSDQ